LEALKKSPSGVHVKHFAGQKYEGVDLARLAQVFGRMKKDQLL